MDRYYYTVEKELAQVGDIDDNEVTTGKKIIRVYQTIIRDSSWQLSLMDTEEVYNFENSEKLVHEFLKNRVKNKREYELIFL